jgi:5-methylcytosine-specific restriction endonuclease McrA
MAYKDIEKQREFQRLRQRKTRADYLRGKTCAKCPTSTGLQIDHIKREDKVTHAIWSWSKARRDEELKKCQILCTPCHKKKTKSEIGTTEHGDFTATVYRNGCRCQLCRYSHAMKMHRYRSVVR